MPRLRLCCVRGWSARPRLRCVRGWSVGQAPARPARPLSSHLS